MSAFRVPLLPSWLRWLAVAVVGGVIFTLSVVVAPPGEPVVKPFDLLPLDKWRHFLAYAAFGGTLAYATSTWRWSTGRLAVFVLGITVAYGVGIEIWQWFLPNRYFGLGDAYANALGAALASPWFLLRDRLSFVSPSEWASAIVD
ncbi:VanZ family protein [Halomicrobium sp. HM KBTZ05]|uniref:VanZ family protein n=1 Tax=Halomicrobium sp. HM KBTZ05 TaxID=3242663 RepID=UPI0035589F83